MKKRSAFTMVECICALLIVSIVILNISLVLTTVRKANNRDLRSSIDWYLFLQEMESPTHRFELIDAHGHTLSLYSQTMKCQYEIKGFDCLYLASTNSGGYMPVLDDVRPFKYNFKKLDEQRVYVEVERTNAKKKKAILNFYPPQLDS